MYYTRDFEGSRVQSRLPSRQVRRAREGYDPARGEGEGETETSMRGRSLNTTTTMTDGFFRPSEEGGGGVREDQDRGW